MYIPMAGFFTQWSEKSWQN